ncbi:CoA-transferase family III protein [Aeromicrobium marinum DSM 15272]|uniref:CoA-transferase family III protein n=1 Tax=Aeromicrobium marinum DSM 15272 TaxID=585531 RepID=E2S8H6_9ACTN|nr:CaiB/BaiF CoA-transferase family protein [Aeromicrobium marinum]EFQ84481.1 CoA-transferase family III protein [Aeromicrobium marinum DSM 15272]
MTVPEPTPSPRPGPLAGVKVVEIVGIGPGPFAAMLLADLGADVIRVDRPGGNAMKMTAPQHDILARGRHTVALDLKSPRGVEVVLDLVASADILIEGFRPGVTERLGFGPEACHARNPALVYGRMTGWGQDGPLAQSAGHDMNYISIAGALDPLGRMGEAPGFPMNLLGDFGGGSLYLVTGVLAALTHARATGEGQVVDAAITDGAAHLMAMAVSMQQGGIWDGQRGTNMLGSAVPYYDVYRTADDRYMSVGPLEGQFWAVLVERIGVELPDRNDFGRWGELRQALTDRFAEKTQAEWTEIFGDSDACVAPVVPLVEAYDHPHNVARGTYVEHHGVTQPAPAPRFSATPAELTIPPAAAGTHTREALTAWGIHDVDGLIADGIAVQRED